MFLYRITNTANGKIYLGITKRSVRKRMADHFSSARNGGATPLYVAMREHGLDAFTVEQISEAGSWNELVAMEIAAIAEHQSNDPSIGYNATAGGDGTLGWVPSPETRLKLSEASTKQMARPGAREHLSECSTRQMADPAQRELISAANRGRVHTAETRAKVSAAGRGRIRSPETRAKLSTALTGKVRPPEVRAKLSAAMTGRHHTDASREAMSQARRGVPKSEDHKASMRAAWVRRKEREAA